MKPGTFQFFFFNSPYLKAGCLSSSATAAGCRRQSQRNRTFPKILHLRSRPSLSLAEKFGDLLVQSRFANIVNFIDKTLPFFFFFAA